jgi:hypothetical protein
MHVDVKSIGTWKDGSLKKHEHHSTSVEYVFEIVITLENGYSGVSIQPVDDGKSLEITSRTGRKTVVSMLL